MADKGATQLVRPQGRGNPGSSVAVTPSVPQQSGLRKRTETLSSTFLGDHSRPSKRTIYLLLIGFAVFIILGSMATQFPTQEMRLIFTTISSALLLCLIAASSLDLATRRHLKYRVNLGNTMLTVLLSMILMIVVFMRRWYTLLNREVLELRTDAVQQVRFPAVAVIEDPRHNYEAQLRDIQTKCFISDFSGDFDEDERFCSTMTSAAILEERWCNCNDSWEHGIQTGLKEDIHEDFRFLSFRPAPYLITNTTNATMTLQVWFSYNTSEFPSVPQWPIPDPRLWIVVYDPAFDLVDAYNRNYAQMNQIDANGASTVWLGLKYIEGIGTVPHYSYDLNIATSANRNLVCNLAGDWTQACYTTLLIRISSMERITEVRGMALDWTAVAAEAGAYFAFVQFLAWILSGQVSYSEA